MRLVLLCALVAATSGKSAWASRQGLARHSFLSLAGLATIVTITTADNPPPLVPDRNSTADSEGKITENIIVIPPSSGGKGGKGKGKGTSSKAAKSSKKGPKASHTGATKGGKGSSASGSVSFSSFNGSPNTGGYNTNTNGGNGFTIQVNKDAQGAADTAGKAGKSHKGPKGGQTNAEGKEANANSSQENKQGGAPAKGAKTAKSAKAAKTPKGSSTGAQAKDGTGVADSGDSNSGGAANEENREEADTQNKEGLGGTGKGGKAAKVGKGGSTGSKGAKGSKSGKGAAAFGSSSNTGNGGKGGSSSSSTSMNNNNNNNNNGNGFAIQVNKDAQGSEDATSREDMSGRHAKGDTVMYMKDTRGISVGDQVTIADGTNTHTSTVTEVTSGTIVIADGLPAAFHDGGTITIVTDTDDDVIIYSDALKEDQDGSITCTADTAIRGVADVRLNNGKSYDKGFTKQQCSNECMAKETCASFVWTAANGYCELWSTDDSTTDWPGTSHCIVREAKSLLNYDDETEFDAEPAPAPAPVDGEDDDDYEYVANPDEAREDVNPDSDGDGVRDDADAFPNDPSETTDTDGDGVGNNADAFPKDASESADTDGDRVGDNEDAFPNDPSETTDTDGDGVGDNADAFPNDPSETTDTDGDGVGNNADAFPKDPSETTDTDGDGMGDNEDAFPNDASETVDTDGDGVGDNLDAFPNDASETVDTDGDGVGDNADAFPNDASETTDTNGNGVGDNAESSATAAPTSAPTAAPCIWQRPVRNHRGMWAARIDVVSWKSTYTREECAALCCSNTECQQYAFQDISRAAAKNEDKNPNICVTYKDSERMSFGASELFDLYMRDGVTLAPTAAPTATPVDNRVAHSAELVVSPIDCNEENYQAVVDRATEEITGNGVAMSRIEELSASCADGGSTILVKAIIYDDEQLAERVGRVMRNHAVYIHTGVPDATSSSTAAPAGGLEQPDLSTSTDVPVVTTDDEVFVTKGMEAEVGVLEAPFIAGDGPTECSMSIYDVAEANSGWGGAFACDGDPLVYNFQMEASVGYTSQECSVLTGLPEHENGKPGADQDLYMTVHGNCKSKASDAQSWRVCSWRPDPSSFLCRTLGMPCCTYVSNMVSENVEESCEDFKPGQCKIVYGFDGKSTKKYGMKMHGCSGEAPYNPMCSISTGEQIMEAAFGTKTRHAAMSKWVIFAGAGMLAFAMALRVRRQRREEEEEYDAAVMGTSDGGGGSNAKAPKPVNARSKLTVSATSNPAFTYGSIIPGVKSPTRDIENGTRLAKASEVIFNEYDD